VFITATIIITAKYLLILLLFQLMLGGCGFVFCVRRVEGNAAVDDVAWNR